MNAAIVRGDEGVIEWGPYIPTSPHNVYIGNILTYVCEMALQAVLS